MPVHRPLHKGTAICWIPVFTGKTGRISGLDMDFRRYRQVAGGLVNHMEILQVLRELQNDNGDSSLRSGWYTRYPGNSIKTVVP